METTGKGKQNIRFKLTPFVLHCLVKCLFNQVLSVYYDIFFFPEVLVKVNVVTMLSGNN